MDPAMTTPGVTSPRMASQAPRPSTADCSRKRTVLIAVAKKPDQSCARRWTSRNVSFSRSQRCIKGPSIAMAPSASALRRPASSTEARRLAARAASVAGLREVASLRPIRMQINAAPPTASQPSSG